MPIEARHMLSLEIDSHPRIRPPREPLVRRLVPHFSLTRMTSFYYVPSAWSTHFVRDHTFSTPLKLVGGSAPEPPAYLIKAYPLIPNYKSHHSTFLIQLSNPSNH